MVIKAQSRETLRSGIKIVCEESVTIRANCFVDHWLVKTVMHLIRVNGDQHQKAISIVIKESYRKFHTEKSS